MSENAIFFKHLHDNLPKGTNGMTALALTTLEERVGEVDRAKAKALCPAHPSLADLGVATAQLSAITLMELKTAQAAVAMHGGVLDTIQRDVEALAKHNLPRAAFEATRGYRDRDKPGKRDSWGWLRALVGGVNLKQGTMSGLVAIVVIAFWVRGEQRDAKLTALAVEAKTESREARRANEAATNELGRMARTVDVLVEEVL